MKRYSFASTLVTLALCAFTAMSCGKGNTEPETPAEPDPGSAPELACRIFLAGDSTCHDYSVSITSARPRYGWGEKLGMWLPKCEVHNHAYSGCSTKSFIDSGRWKAIEESLKKGDLVLIQFSHNDEKTADPDRYTEPYGSFSDNLRKFVSESRAKEAVPVLVTPICRRSFDSNDRVKKSHGTYPAAMKKVATDNNVPLIDSEQQTYEWLDRLGVEKSKAYFMISVDGSDNTHLTEAGAEDVSKMIADALKELNEKWLLKSSIK